MAPKVAVGEKGINIYAPAQAVSSNELLTLFTCILTQLDPDYRRNPR
jgi:hypothetical protein